MRWAEQVSGDAQQMAACGRSSSPCSKGACVDVCEREAAVRAVRAQEQASGTPFSGILSSTSRLPLC